MQLDVLHINVCGIMHRAALQRGNSHIQTHVYNRGGGREGIHPVSQPRSELRSPKSSHFNAPDNRSGSTAIEKSNLPKRVVDDKEAE